MGNLLEVNNQTLHFKIMKKFFTLLLSVALITSCTDYDSQFDQLDNKIQELDAANSALESQLAAMAALNASVSAQTTAKLAEFQGAVGAIVQALQSLGTASAATIAQVNGIIQAISDLAAQVAANAATAEEIAAAIAAIQDMLDTINENVLHHSGGGAHSSGGTTDTASVTPTDNGDGALNLIVSVPAGTTALRLSGPWWGWNPSGGPVAVDNGDGTFTFTLDPAPTADMEYLYTLDGASYEVLYDNAGNGECTERVDAGLINTDYFSYGNRIWKVGSGDQAETYDSCSIDTVTAD